MVLTEWFQFEPGDFTVYELGISIPPSFVNGCHPRFDARDGSGYVQVVYKTGYCQFNVRTLSAGYLGGKLNIKDGGVSQRIVDFIKSWVRDKEAQQC